MIDYDIEYDRMVKKGRTTYAQSRDNVGAPWDMYQERLLSTLIHDCEDLDTICNVMQRNPGGIAARIHKLVDNGILDSWEIDYLRSSFDYPLIDTRKEFINLNEIDIKHNIPKIMEKHMSNKSGKTWTMVSMLQENIITLKVAFDNNISKQYTYKTRDKSITTDDYVIVNPGAVEGNFSVGKVMKIDDVPDFDLESHLRYHWIVSKIDATEYNALVASDEKAYEMLVNAEKHVARKKLVEMYTEALSLPNAEELQKLLQGNNNE